MLNVRSCSRRVIHIRALSLSRETPGYLFLNSRIAVFIAVYRVRRSPNWKGITPASRPLLTSLEATFLAAAFLLYSRFSPFQPEIPQPIAVPSSIASPSTTARPEVRTNSNHSSASFSLISAALAKRFIASSPAPFS